MPIQDTVDRQAEMLAFDPPVIWSIASGTAVAPRSKYCGTISRSWWIIKPFVVAMGRLCSHIETVITGLKKMFFDAVC